MKRIIGIVLAGTALAGCGSTKHITTTRTATVTTTQTTVRTRVQRAGYASTYPSSFETAFAAQCTHTGGTHETCGCALRHIEQAVRYHAVVAQAHRIATGNPPNWYTGAISACEG